MRAPRLLLVLLSTALVLGGPSRQGWAAPSGVAPAAPRRVDRAHRPGGLRRLGRSLRRVRLGTLRAARHLRRNVRQRVERGRSTLAALWQRGTPTTHDDGTIELLSVRIHPKTVGSWSTASLLMASANEALAVGTRLGPLAGPLTGVGSIGLGVYSIHGLINAKSPEARLDAAHGVAWSLQGAAGLVRLTGLTGLKTAGKVLGVGGGLLQASLGAYRLVAGLRGHDKRRTIIGGLDLGAGLCWAATACSIGGPLALGGFIGLTSARLAYSYRKPLDRLVRRLLGLPPRGDAKVVEPGETPKVIVTKPTSEAVAAQATRGTGATTVRDATGQKAVVTPAVVRSSDGQDHPVVVVTPVDPNQTTP